MARTDPMIEATPESVPTGRASRWAWGLCWLMFASTALCYMDRQAIALVAPKIRQEYGLSNESFGWVLAAFSLTYAIVQIPAGYAADRGNVRRVYATAVIWWSAAGIASAVAPTLGFLLACRALLGMGEAFNWPAALRVTSRILPRADRGLGNGIFNSGAAVGAVLTPLTVPLLTVWFGWRAAFAVIGSLGFLWVVAWLILSGRGDPSAFAGRGSRRERPDAVAGPRSGLAKSASMAFGLLVAASLMTAGMSYWYGLRAVWLASALLMIGGLIVARLLPVDPEGPDWARSLGEIVRLRRFWTLTVVAITINMCWHFLVNWMPSYLQDDRGMAFLKGGLVSAIPFLAADAGNLLGGVGTRHLARRGLGADRARLVVMAGCALLISAGAWVGVIENNVVVVVLLAIMALGTAAFMANYFAACQEVAPRHTGLVVGILGGLGNLFVAGFLPEAGRVKDLTGGFGPVFVAAGLLPFVGLAALTLGWRGDPPATAESD